MKRYLLAAAIGLLGLSATWLTSSTPTSAVSSPQRWIAYADNAGIHLVHPDGSNRHLLVAKPGARYPSWSPNGRRLAYAQLTSESSVTAQTTIQLIRPDGTGAKTVTAGYDPSWLNAKWILFHGVANIIGIRYDPGGLLKVNVVTGEVKPIEIAHLTNDAYVGNGRGVPDYQLSPDRKSIFWNGSPPAAAAGPAAGTETLKTIGLDGSGYHAIAVRDAASAGIGGWMPGGKAVTYPCIRADKEKVTIDLCAVDLATTKVTDLSARRSYAYGEEWSAPSPDGTRIVVGATDALYVTNPAGRDFRLLLRISTASGNPTGPVWQP